MKEMPGLFNGFHLRVRLLRRVQYRLWKSLVVSHAGFRIGSVRCEVPVDFSRLPPSIFLTTFDRPEDYHILAYVLDPMELTFAAPRNLPEEKTLERLKTIHHLLPVGDLPDYSFFKAFLSVLRNFNRSIVLAPEAARRYTRHWIVDPTILARLAMAANAPVIPVSMRWREAGGWWKSKGEKCDVWIGKKMFISPRTEEFKDIFFKRRGFRKYRDLPREDLTEIGNRIFRKLETLGEPRGSDLPEKMGAAIL